jgi:translation initiation factor IF-2
VVDLTKIKVYELAKELSLESKDIMNILRKIGCEVKSHMSSIDDSLAEKVRHSASLRPVSKHKSVPAPPEMAKAFVPKVTRIPKAAMETKAEKNEEIGNADTVEQNADEKVSAASEEKKEVSPPNIIEGKTEKEESVYGSEAKQEISVTTVQAKTEEEEKPLETVTPLPPQPPEKETEKQAPKTELTTEDKKQGAADERVFPRSATASPSKAQPKPYVPPKPFSGAQSGLKKPASEQGAPTTGVRVSFGGKTQGGQYPRPSYGGKAQGGQYARPPYGDKAQGGQYARPSYGDKAQGGQYPRPSYGDKAQGGQYARPSSGDKAQGGQYVRPPYGDKAQGGQYARPSSGGKAQGGQYPRPSYGDKSQIGRAHV